MSAAPLVIWSVVKKTSSFRKASAHDKREVLSGEPLNAAAKHSYAASGFAQRNRVGVVRLPDSAVSAMGKKGSGYALVSFDAERAKSPKNSVKRTELPKALAAGAATVTTAVGDKRKDLLASALARFSRVRKAGYKVKPIEKGVKTGSRADRKKAAVKA